MSGQRREIQYPIPLPDGARIVVVPPEDFPKALDVLERAFPKIARTFFYFITHRDPAYRPSFCLAVEREDVFCSYVQIFDRTLVFPDRTLRVGGIGSVGTAPEARGRKYASALMKHAMRVMEHEGMDGGMLYTSIQPFYEALGWLSLRQWEQEIPIEPLRHTPPAPDSFRPIQDTDLPVLLAVYESLQGRAVGTLRRSPDYWRQRSSWMNHAGTAVFDRHKMIGYFYAAQYKKDEPILTVSEYGIADAGEHALESLLRVMAWKASETGCARLRGFFRQDPLMGDFLDRRDWIGSERLFPYVMWWDGPRPAFDAIQSLAEQRRFLYWQTDAF